MILNHVPAYAACQAIDPSREAYFIQQRNTPTPSSSLQLLAGETLKRILICARNRPARQNSLPSMCREMVIG
jgi:predicted RNA-binding Zn ribbon-like protein